VADSPYTSVYDMFAYQMKRMFHIPDIPVLPSTSIVTQLRAGYSLKEASALEQVKTADVPILYIHGEADTLSPTDMSQERNEDTAREAELMTITSAGHGEGYVIAENKYIDKLNRFLNKYIE